MMIWAKLKGLFKRKKLRRYSTIPWPYLNKSNKTKGKRTERAVVALYLVLSGKIGDELAFKYINPHTKCLEIY